MGQVISIGGIVNRARFSKACEGKYGKEGGMSTEELRDVATERGVDWHSLGRRALINKLCPPKSSLSRVNIEYISPEFFFKRYPQGKVLGEGTYGEVYSSGDYAVKKSRLSADISTTLPKPHAASVSVDIIREMNFYASVFHPCILRPVSWTYIEPFTYVVMPKGEDIINAYKSNLISIKQIVSDTLSAIAYMNSLGIAHCDIKPKNMIFHDGHAKIIDMGFARNATLFPDNKYKIKGLAYSHFFRDPEYVDRVWNPISTELYALAKAYYEILGCEDVTNLSNMYSFSNADPSIDWLFSEAKLMNRERPTTYELLDNSPQNLIVRRHVGEELDTPEVPFQDYCKGCPTCAWEISPAMLVVVCGWLIDVCVNFQYAARTLFAGLHLIQRTVHVVKGKSEKLQLLGAVCMYLAAVIFEDDVYVISEWTYLCGGAYTEKEFSEMVKDIIITAKCIITGPTPWDYAKYAEDLPPMLNDIIKCDYDPMHTRPLSIFGTSKNISVEELKVIWKMGTLASTETASEEPSSIHPCSIIDAPPSLHVVMDEPGGWGQVINDHRTYKDHVVTLEHFSKLLYARDILFEMNITDAQSVYNLLLEYKEVFRSGIDKLFQFDWLNTSSEQLQSLGLHPFLVRQTDLVPPSLRTVLDGPDGWRALISTLRNYDNSETTSSKPVVLQTHISKLLYAKDILRSMEINDARSVYALLRAYKDKENFKDDVAGLFNFDWYNTSCAALYQNHPFKATRADFRPRYQAVPRSNKVLALKLRD